MRSPQFLKQGSSAQREVPYGHLHMKKTGIGFTQSLGGRSMKHMDSHCKDSHGMG